MSEKSYYQRNIDVILNRAKQYYENDLNSFENVWGEYFLFALITESSIIIDKHLHSAFSFGIFFALKICNHTTNM